MGEQARWARLVEGVVIVLSILLAFIVDAWWDGRQERALEQQYIIRLVSEVDGHSESASGLATFQERIRDDALLTYDLLASGELESVDAFEALKRAYDATRTLTPDFTVDVYRELLATGNLRLFEDQAVRSRVTSYYESLDAPPQFEMASLEYRDLVRGIIPPRTKLVIRACRGAASTAVCDWQISESEARSILRRLAAAPGVLEGASHVVEQWDRGASYLGGVASLAAEVSEFLSRSMAEH